MCLCGLGLTRTARFHSLARAVQIDPYSAFPNPFLIWTGEEKLKECSLFVIRNLSGQVSAFGTLKLKASIPNRKLNR